MLSQALISPPSGQSDSAPPATAIVKSVSAQHCDVYYDGKLQPAAVATHILHLAVGQRVAVIDGGLAGMLVIAAWPLAGETISPFQFDAATGTLTIQSARLNLSALATINLQCGEARLRLTLDGKAQIEGMEVVSTALGSNRIEGASIDLN